MAVKKISSLILFMIFLVLTGCTSENPFPPEILSDNSSNRNETDIKEKESPMEETIAEEARTEEIEPLQKETPNETYPFVMPDFSHEYADEMIQLVTEFGHEFYFPEFEKIEELDLASWSVSSNLYWLTYFLNDELLVQGRGITVEQKENLLKGFENIYTSIVRCGDMTFIGRRYFGDDFSFPKNLIGREIAPLETNLDYYIWTNARSFVGPRQYLLTDVQHESNDVIATFLLYYLHLDGDFNFDTSIVTGINFFNPNYSQDGVSYFAAINPPRIASEERITSDYLEACILPVPQNQLGTITVTFRRENDGRLIATSSRYNREDH